MVRKYNSNSVESTVVAATTIIIIEGSGAVVVTMCIEVSEAATEETVIIADNVANTEVTMSKEVVTTKVNKATGAITIATSSNRRNKTTSKLCKTQVNRTTITEEVAEAEVITNQGSEVPTEVIINVAITTIGDAMSQPLVKTANPSSRDTLIIEAVALTNSLLTEVVAALTARKRSVQGLRSKNKPTMHPSKSEACT